MIQARKEIRTDYYRTDGGFLVISPTQEADLLALGTINKANEFGSQEALRNAYIGRLFGFDIMVSDAIAATSNVEYALAIGRHPSGERAFGFAIKRPAMIESEYHALGRYYDFVGHEEWDVEVLHPNAICKIATYQA
jgi:hypothetical protein